MHDQPEAVKEVEAVAGTPGRPPFLRVRLRVAGNAIREATYQTFGCTPAIAAGRAMTELATGRDVAACAELAAADVAERLGGLPPERMWAAELAIAALRAALKALSDVNQGG